MDIEDIKALNDTAYKMYHESLMQNNHGSSSVHVFFCIFFTVQCSIYSSLTLQNVTNYYLKSFCEFIIIVLPLTLAHTILAKYIYYLNGFVTLLVIFEVRPYLHKLTGSSRILCRRPRLLSISIMRSLTYLITLFAILAVDFQSFPRYLAKTERYGLSLMDTGVGLFVLMSGLVHKDLRTHSLFNVLRSNVRLLISLCIFGVLRHVLVKRLNYQEHVTEYGVHWNFFFTLAVCKLVSITLLHFVPNNFATSLFVLSIHEVTMASFLMNWVFSDAKRDTFLSANKEGIASCLGYVSMYIFGAFLKDLVKEHPITCFSLKLFNIATLRLDTLQIQLSLMSAFFWLLFMVHNYVVPASRTLANASYCWYMESVLLTVVTLLYFLEKLVEDEKDEFPMPIILRKINSQGFWYFIIANIFTGIINMYVRTLAITTDLSVLILNCYMVGVYVATSGITYTLFEKPILYETRDV